MTPTKEGFLNRMTPVQLPNARDLFSRFGRSTSVGVKVEDNTSYLNPRKNDVIDEVERLASNAEESTE